MTKHEELDLKIREVTAKNSPLFTDVWLKRDTLNELMRESSYSSLDDERDEVEVLHFENGQTMAYTREGTLYYGDGSAEGKASWKIVRFGDFQAQRYPRKGETVPVVL